MARGRMLNKSVSGSVKFHNLPDDTCRLLATWIIAHLDVQGVFYGDPAMVKSIVFPRRTDLSAEQIDGYLTELERHHLMVRFEAKGDIWQYWPGFLGEQIGLRTDRETPDYPPPPDHIKEDPWSDTGEYPASIRQVSGNMPAEEKLREVKGSEENNNSGADAPTKPANYNGWLTLLKASKNRKQTVAILVDMACTLYPEKLTTDDEGIYARIGKMAKDLGSASGMASLLWGNSRRALVDPLDYLTKIIGDHKPGDNGRNPPDGDPFTWDGNEDVEVPDLENWGT